MQEDARHCREGEYREGESRARSVSCVHLMHILYAGRNLTWFVQPRDLSQQSIPQLSPVFGGRCCKDLILFPMNQSPQTALEMEVAPRQSRKL